MNLYTYVGNNPVNYVDRMGLEKKLYAEQYKNKFIRAYEDYLEIKNSIYNIGGGYDLGYLILSSEEKEKLKMEYIIKEKLAKELHYGRNQLNTINVPDNVNNLDMDIWQNLSYVKSIFHQKTAVLHTPNVKFISKDGHQEVVYKNDGFLENDIEDIGTYNFYNPLNEAVLHTKYDVDPYFEWGNGYNDLTNKITRRYKF